MRRVTMTMAVLLVLGMAMGALGQSSATASVTVVAAPKPATVTIAPSTSVAPVGSTVVLKVTAGGASGAATGNIELLGKAASGGSYALIQTFPLQAGAVTCSYPLPTDAPLGTYSVEAALCGSSTYENSPDCQ